MGKCYSYFSPEKEKVKKSTRVSFLQRSERSDSSPKSPTKASYTPPVVEVQQTRTNGNSTRVADVSPMVGSRVNSTSSKRYNSPMREICHGDSSKQLANPLGESLVNPPVHDKVHIRGWLMKRGHMVQNWKKRYVIISKDEIRYFVKDSDKYPFGEGQKGHVCFSMVCYCW